MQLGCQNDQMSVGGGGRDLWAKNPILPSCRSLASVVFLPTPSRDFCPCQVAQACLYLAAKAEECTVQLKLLKHFLEKRQQRAFPWLDAWQR